MNTTGVTPELDPEVEQALHRLVAAEAMSLNRDWQTAQPARGTTQWGTRGVGSEVMPTPSAPADQDAQRLLTAYMTPLLETFVPKAVQAILDLFQQRRGELGLPQQRDVQQDLADILGPLLKKLIEAQSVFKAAVSGPAPRSPEEEAERCFPVVGVLLSAVMSAAYAASAKINRQRNLDAQPISDPEVAERWLGPAISVLGPLAIKHGPSLLGSIASIFRSGPEIATSTTNTW